MDAINVNLLAHPTPNIRLMELDRWRAGQLVKMMMMRELWTPDEWRTIPRCHLILSTLFPPQSVPPEVRTINLVYEVGDWAGMLAFTKIVPEYKADVLLKYWDEKQFKPKLYRELKETLGTVIEELGLKRVSCATADKKMKKFAENMGFTVECRQRLGFRWDGKFYTQYLMRLLREEKNGA